MRECLLVLVVVSLFGMMSCQKNPSSSDPDEPEHYVLRGEVYNNFPDTPGPIWQASVQLISASDTISTQTDDRGQFEFGLNASFSSEAYRLIVQRVFFNQSERSFTVPDSSFNTGYYDVGKITLELNDDGLYVAGEIERSVDDDSVVVFSHPAYGCDGNGLNNEDDVSLQNIGSASNFSLAIRKSCEEIYYFNITSTKHRERFYELNLKNYEIKGSPPRIDGLRYKIFEDVEPEHVFVRMHFYTMMNGEKRTPIWGFDEKFDVTASNSYAKLIKPDMSGTLEFDATISPGRDTASVVLWDSQLHSFSRTNFALLDYKEEGSDTIDLGEFEVDLKGVYVFGKLNDPYFEIDGDIDLSVNGGSYPVENEGHFVFPAQKSQNSHSIVVSGEHYLQTDTTISLSQLQADGDIYTGLIVPLRSSLFDLKIQVDFIGIEGGVLSTKEIPIDMMRYDGAVEESYSSAGNGVFTTRVNTKTGTNRKTDKLWIGINSFNNSNRLENYTAHYFTIEFDQYENHIIEKNVHLYELGPEIDYTPEIQVGTKWEFDYLEFDDPVVVEGHTDVGTLYWEITEQLSDTTYVLKESFEGVHIFHYIMGDVESESNKSNSEYLLTVAEGGRIKFKTMTEGPNPVEFTKSFDYELNLRQPSTNLGEYTYKNIVGRDYSTGYQPEKIVTFTYSEESGIKYYDYTLYGGGDIFLIEAKLNSYTP